MSALQTVWMLFLDTRRIGGMNGRLFWALVFVFGLAVVPGIALSPPADMATEPATSQALQHCNYAQLYNETIDSVVLVQIGGGQGSGFVYDVADDGSAYVVTNEHVVNESSEVLVKFKRGETVAGTVVGKDALSDLAVIRVERLPEYAAPLSLNQDRPVPGQPVAALGSPYGLQSTITSGIVSGTNRSIPTKFGYAIPNTIQTDAPINPGNSGGPLVECPSGQVIGVNRAGGGDNIGFAVPASIVERVVPALIEDGEYEHAFLGVSASEVTAPVAAANDLNTSEGLLVVRTVRGTPASEVFRESRAYTSVSGVRIPVGGDVIVAVENRSVETPGDLARFLALYATPGETVEVTVLRDGERRIVNVTLVERPAPNDV